MEQANKNALRSTSPYNAVITREQFLFYETRTTAKLVCDGLDRDAILEKIVRENLFQYPTERSIRGMGLTCLRRLDALGNDTLVHALATQPSEDGKLVITKA